MTKPTLPDAVSPNTFLVVIALTCGTAKLLGGGVIGTAERLGRDWAGGVGEFVGGVLGMVVWCVAAAPVMLFVVTQVRRIDRLIAAETGAQAAAPATPSSAPPP